jgi:deoxyhypusine synthase
MRMRSIRQFRLDMCPYRNNNTFINSHSSPMSMTRKDVADARESIFKSSKDVEGTTIRGYDCNKPFDLHQFLANYGSSGFQATHLHKGIEILKRVRAAREANPRFVFFLGYTSNQVSSGNRELIRYLVQHKLVDAIVTTAGGIEEDIIKCIKPFVLGDFRANGAQLREQGINRTGNIFVPNDRYIAFEQFLKPILDELTATKTKQHTIAPSELIRILGQRINHEDSIYYWAAKHNIPVFCPAVTDGSIGDITFFYQYTEQKLFIDIAGDNATLNKLAIDADQTGALIVGAGLIKHQILNANMMREGLDYSVYLNTSQEFDGSDSGAEPEEAKSWGKIAPDANTVKIICDATIALPLIVVGVWEQV